MPPKPAVGVRVVAISTISECGQADPVRVAKTLHFPSRDPMVIEVQPGEWVKVIRIPTPPALHKGKLIEMTRRGV
jgi:hypothetical protein